VKKRCQGPIAGIILIISACCAPACLAGNAVFYRIAGTNGSGIVSYGSDGMMVFTSSLLATSFQVESATGAIGTWTSNTACTILSNTGPVKRVFLPPGGGQCSVPLCVLTQAANRVWIGQHEYRLDPYLWRDFMPSTDPLKGLIALVELVEMQSNAIPASVGLSQIWVDCHDAIWNAPLGEVMYWNTYTLRGIARDGPYWEPGITVDVTVEVTDANVKYLLRATNLLIHFVW
jgi:hypothetical protein